MFGHGGFSNNQRFVFLKSETKDAIRIAKKIDAANIDFDAVSESCSDDVSEGGDCFYATTRFLQLASEGGMKNLTLKTGIFKQSHDDIFHSWIETTTGLSNKKYVINVSNLKHKGQAVKIYSLSYYKKANDFHSYIQSLTHKEFLERVVTQEMHKDNPDGVAEVVWEDVKHIALKETLELLREHLKHSN